MKRVSPHARAGCRLLVLGLVLSTVGCATYSERMQGARTAANQGDYATGEAALGDFIGEQDPSGQPAKFGPETGLAMLERAITEAGEHRQAAALLEEIQ